LIDLKLVDAEGHGFALHSKELPYLLAGSSGQWQVADPSHLLRSGERLHLTTRGRVDAQDSWLTLAP
jgi:fimbrial chaperone protein